jgi:hypothetical protein
MAGFCKRLFTDTSPPDSTFSAEIIPTPKDIVGSTRIQGRSLSSFPAHELKIFLKKLAWEDWLIDQDALCRSMVATLIYAIEVGPFT